MKMVIEHGKSWIEEDSWTEKNVTRTQYSYNGMFLFNVSDTQESRQRCAKYLLSLRKHDYKYMCLFSPNEDVFEFINWIAANKYTFVENSSILDLKDGAYDFHGNLNEYSAAFMYRIYDTRIVNKIISQLQSHGLVIRQD